MDLTNRKVIRSCSSTASRQHIIIIEHVSLVHPPCTHQLMSTVSIYVLTWSGQSFQFIMITSKVLGFLFRTYFSSFGKIAGETSCIYYLYLTKLFSIIQINNIIKSTEAGLVIFLSRSLARKSLIERMCNLSWFMLERNKF